MNPKRLFDFTVDKDKHAIQVTREFAAELDLVWEAWTDAELLDQWWAPKPYRVRTKSMDFREGGMWLYAMVSPTDEEFWCRADYQSIVPQKSFTAEDGFCNEKGDLTEGMPRSLWSNVFQGGATTTTVRIHIQYANLADLEKIVAMGFKEGLTMTLDNLDQYLAAGFRLRQENKKINTARVCTYLNFPGTTEAAFLFYRKVFKTGFIGRGIQRFGEIPPDAGHPPVPDAIKQMVLHIELPITANHVLMATDAPKEMGFTLTEGNNMHICVEPSSREEAKRLFDALSEGGKVTMPLQDMFFGAYFGELTDQFGINWMINHQNESR